MHIGAASDRHHPSEIQVSGVLLSPKAVRAARQKLPRAIEEKGMRRGAVYCHLRRVRLLVVPATHREVSPDANARTHVAETARRPGAARIDGRGFVVQRKRLRVVQIRGTGLDTDADVHIGLVRPTLGHCIQCPPKQHAKYRQYRDFSHRLISSEKGLSATKAVYRSMVQVCKGQVSATKY